MSALGVMARGIKALYQRIPTFCLLKPETNTKVPIQCDIKLLSL